jgi:hypothetical protein
MNKILSFAAVAVMVASSSVALARGGGASGFSPGHQMRNAGGPAHTVHGASSYSPGHLMRNAGGPANTVRGASTFAPGHLK